MKNKRFLFIIILLSFLLLPLGCITSLKYLRIAEEEQENLRIAKEEEEEKFRKELQELRVELNRLRQGKEQSLSSLNEQIKNIEEEKDKEKKEKVIIAKKINDMVEETEKREKVLNKEIQLLESELKETHFQLNKLIEPKLKKNQKLKKMKREISNRLQKYVQSGKVQIWEEERGLTIALINILGFKEKKVIIKKSAEPLLKKVALILKKYPSHKFSVEGHTDDLPLSSSFYRSNWDLSVTRAVIVLQYLEKERGIPAESLSAKGWGEYRPLSSNTTSWGRKKNKRVEIVIITKD